MVPCTIKVRKFEQPSCPKNQVDYRHCGKPTDPAFGGPNDNSATKQSRLSLWRWIASLSLSSAARSRDPLVRNDGQQSTGSRSMRPVLRRHGNMPPENPPPSAAPVAGGEGSGADWDPVR